MKLQAYLGAIFVLSCNLLQIAVAVNVRADNVTDRQALLRFKEAVVDDPHGVLSSWNESVHFCGWLGVACSRRHSLRVTALNLSSRSLRGAVSPYIGNLTFLRYINLMNNSFFGEIPLQVGRLHRLQHLILTNNTFRGGIPVSLINCSELRVINMMGNKLGGVIPVELGFLAKLETLQVSVNNLTGGIPSSLGNVSTLRLLSAGVNNLVGNIPDNIGRLQNLQLFAAPVNKLHGRIPTSIYNLSSIYFLSLAYNNLSGTLPLNFGVRPPKLKQLGFFGNQLSGPIPDSISNASRLQLLDLGSNNFVGQVPKSLGNLSDLWWLNLGGNHLGGNSSHDLAVLAYLGRCKKLEKLGLDSNNFGGVLPDSIGDFSNQLGYLYLGQNSIHGRIPRALENLVNLFCLAMENNAIAGEIPENFGKFGKMQVLSLAGNRLSGKIPSSIGNLTQLFVLDLSRNSLNGNIPPSIKKVRTLQFLDLSHNNLSGEVPAQVLSLPFLSLMLNLSHNILTGNLPVEVGILKNLNTLDISANNLSGEIPRTIGDCSSLESLYLQGNSFDEKIPSTLASLKGLVHLDLSRNNLTGPIPDNLLKLTFLLYLNLSFNHLEGEVPNKGIFQNASAVSVVGNAKLCGGATELQLPRCPIKKLEQRKSHGLRLTIIIVCVAALFLLCSFLYVLYRRRALQMTSLSAYSIGFLPKVSYKALYRATNGFSSSVLIGSGSFGTVYKGLLDNEENEVAIKVLNLQQKGAFKSFVRECNALKTIRHRNLVKILTCCSSMDYHGNEFKALVYEYMPNGSLDKWLHPVTANENQSRVGLNLIQRLDVAVDVSSALSYLHNHCEQPVIHCDLKPSNILLDNKMLAHINDFGLAQLMSPTESFSKSQTSTTGIKGTVGYAAPEYAMGVAPSRHGDVYSYGILVLEMFTGKRPTDEMFIGDLNLHNFVQMALPERLVQIVDSALLPREVEETNAEIGEIYGKSGGNQIDIDGTGINPDKMSIKLQKCLVSILEIGLACSVDSPKERMNMGDVTRELQHIRKAYTGVGIAN